MSTADLVPGVTQDTGAGHAHGEHGHDDHGHSPHLAHHFESYEQQFDAGKLGIWLFLVTEVLFFSGLFCAYIIFRVLQPEIFAFGHLFLNKELGAINTVVLLVSSLTMALAVRASQLGQQKLLVTMLAITIACAVTFMGIKYVEYSTKFQEGLFPGGMFKPTPAALLHAAHVLHEKHAAHHGPNLVTPAYDQTHEDPVPAAAAGHDAHGHDAHGEKDEDGFTAAERKLIDSVHVPNRAGIFFSIYFCLTGLHGIHIIAGVIAISWVLVRSIKGHFTPQYFGPVEYVGLYWHLVDLIWIYLFPLLYLVS